MTRFTLYYNFIEIIEVSEVWDMYALKWQRAHMSQTSEILMR